jgi:hypothetical protein
MLEGVVAASLGLSAKGSGCLVLDFKSRDDAAAFLQKMADKTFSPEDLPLHCQNVQIADAVGGGVAVVGQVELGKIPVMDNTPVGGKAVFTAGFEAAGHIERRVETDASAQTVSTTTSARGRLGLSMTVGKAEEEDEDAAEEVDVEEDFAGAGVMDMAAEASLEVGDETRAVFGRGVVVNASAGREDSNLKCELSVTAARSSTVARSTRSDALGRLESASHNVSVTFSGRFAQTQFEKYASDNLGAEPAVVQAMLADIQENGTPFELEAALTLKSEAAERCRSLEAMGSQADEVRALLKDESNYELSSLKLLFGGRVETEAGRGGSLSLGVVKAALQREAKAAERVAVEYKVENGALQAPGRA